MKARLAHRLTLGSRLILFVLAAALAAPIIVQADTDPYENYVKTSKDFKRVKQDKDWTLKAYPSWVFMPWYYKWPLGFDDASGAFCKEHGINGAFVDHGNNAYLPWIDKFELKFYADHTAGKGDLHQWDGGKETPFRDEIMGTGVRVKPVNDAMKTKLQGVIKKSIDNLISSPMRAAYALDDEISWGHFVRPCMWCITDDKDAYQSWLHEIYGDHAPQREGWISYNDILPKLSTWDIGSFDASQLMDQWTFNDSYWNNFLGDLVEYANSVDPATPCGFVGGQAPSPFGGFDYAKVMRKIQYLEAYNSGSMQSMARSLVPHNAVPGVTSFFYRSPADTIWQSWYYLAQGNRGHIGWVDEKWFKGETPAPWIKAATPTWIECGQKIGPLVSGAEWKHDGVAVYYSQPSIQLGWILDAQAHGKTWVNRNNDHKLGSASLGRNAWLNMLRDEGIQFNWISYADAIQDGISPDYKVLILPACLCLSDAEARQIREFCQNGGTVIADYMPGLWDQHGKGRAAGGALDDMFGVKHDPSLSAKDFFNGTDKLWCETNQELNFNYKKYEELLTNGSTCIKDDSGFNKAERNAGVAHVNKFGKGSAVLLNLSPQWYNAYRVAGAQEAAKRAVFMKPIHDAGIDRWVKLTGADNKEFGYEITYWRKGNRTIAFVVANLEVATTELGGGNAVGLKSDALPVTLQFSHPMNNVKDERGGKDLGNGAEFKFDWKMNEALVVSFDSN